MNIIKYYWNGFINMIKSFSGVVWFLIGVFLIFSVLSFFVFYSPAGQVTVDGAIDYINDNDYIIVEEELMLFDGEENKYINFNTEDGETRYEFYVSEYDGKVLKNPKAKLVVLKTADGNKGKYVIHADLVQYFINDSIVPIRQFLYIPKK